MYHHYMYLFVGYNMDVILMVDILLPRSYNMITFHLVIEVPLYFIHSIIVIVVIVIVIVVVVIIVIVVIVVIIIIIIVVVIIIIIVVSIIV